MQFHAHPGGGEGHIYHPLPKTVSSPCPHSSNIYPQPLKRRKARGVERQSSRVAGWRRGKRVAESQVKTSVPRAAAATFRTKRRVFVQSRRTTKNNKKNHFCSLKVGSLWIKSLLCRNLTVSGALCFHVSRYTVHACPCACIKNTHTKCGCALKCVLFTS